jgi:putative two-component system protein, hydrogenase maturation factor HypX/HoxX
MLANNVEQSELTLDWNHPTDAIAQVIRSREREGGAIDWIGGQAFYLHGVHEEDLLRGEPGRIIATRGDAICRATANGGLWITHLRSATRRRDEEAFKLPATHVLRQHLQSIGVPESVHPLDQPYTARTYREIWYEESNGVGYLNFQFLNGAMSTRHCRELHQAYQHALGRKTRVIVLLGGAQAWSNGIHLNLIEDAAYPGEASWDNINAINDLAREILETGSHLVVSGLLANAGAGGAMLALAADRVIAHQGTVVHPHYRTMGGLYGSEYWTYVLPRRVGEAAAQRLTSECKPLRAAEGLALGFFDHVAGSNGLELRCLVREYAESLQQRPDFERLLADKRRRRASDELMKPLESYRREELRHMWQNFFGPDQSYHHARRRFVRKLRG